MLGLWIMELGRILGSEIGFWMHWLADLEEERSVTVWHLTELVTL